MNDKWFYVFVRTDISLADQICQVAHACVEAGKKFRIDEHANLVLLAVEGKQELADVSFLAFEHGVKTFCHIEPDDNMGPTALCTEAVEQAQRKWFRSFKLWKRA